MVVLRCERPPELGHGAGVEKMCRRADSGGTGDDHTRSRARAARVRRRRNNALRAIVVMGGRYRRQASVRQARMCTSAQADASGAALFQSRHDVRRSDAMGALRSSDSKAPEFRDSPIHSSREAGFNASKGANGQFLTNLAAAGIDAKAIDAVIISHYHGDHVNGLLKADNSLGSRPFSAKTSPRMVHDGGPPSLGCDAVVSWVEIHSEMLAPMARVENRRCAVLPSR